MMLLHSVYLNDELVSYTFLLLRKLMIRFYYYLMGEASDTVIYHITISFFATVSEHVFH